MLLGLNGATTMKYDLPTDVRVAQQAGFQCVELHPAKLRKYLEKATTAELAELLQQAGIKPLSISSVERVTYAGDQWERIEREYRELSRIAGEIGCEVLIATPGVRPAGATDGEVKDEHVSVLEALADIALGDGIKLGFEFQSYPNCSVRTLEAAWDIVSELDRAEVGLVIDTFHIANGGTSLNALRRVKSEKVFVFQVGDCEKLPPGKAQSNQRLLPGAGTIPIRKIWDDLNAVGFDRLATVEAPRQEYWERNPAELAVEAKQALAKSLGLK